MDVSDISAFKLFLILGHAGGCVDATSLYFVRTVYKERKTGTAGGTVAVSNAKKRHIKKEKRESECNEGDQRLHGR